MDVIFFGSGAFGLPTLQALSREHRVTCIVTQPDKPAGRGGSLTPTPIGAWAATHLPNVPLLKPENVNEPGVLATIRSTSADAWVVIAFGQKLSQPLLVDRFAINLHASLLPRWRGAAPINWAILAGDKETGNSVITLADKMDAGLVLGHSRRTIDPSFTIGELHDLLSSDGPSLVLHVLAQHAAGTLSPATQDPAKVTLARKLNRADGYVDFSQSAEECRRRVHGLTPWPGVAAMFRGQAIKLLRVSVNEPSPVAQEPRMAIPGTVIDPATGTLACGMGSILTIMEVQPPGRKSMPWADYARGARVTIGERFEMIPPPSPPSNAPKVAPKEV